MSRSATALGSIKTSLYYPAGRAKIARVRVCLGCRQARTLSNKSGAFKDGLATLAVKDSSCPPHPQGARTWDKSRFRSGLTWLVRDPTAVDPKSITSRMVQACCTENPDPTRVRSIVLLVTPLLAHLLDPEVCLKPVMRGIYGDLRTRTGTHVLSVTSVAAVVDALPGPLPHLPERTPLISEGVALLMSSASSSNRLEHPQSQSTDEVEPVILQFLSNSTHTHDMLPKTSTAVVRHMTLPVANTIFVNGNRATLLEDSWKVTIRETEAAAIDHQDRRSLKSARVDMACSGNDFLQASVPLQSLTSPRKVVRSMGNVLAEVEVDGRAVPASRELEKAVTDYINANPTRATHGPFQIFALVQPPGTSYGEGQDFAGVGKPAGRVLQALWQDAKLFKVTGGGGGWGKKQGLLSLDTAVDFGTVGATVGFPDFETTVNLSHEIGSHGMIPRDGTVEFFLCSDDRVPQTRLEGAGAQETSSSKEEIYGPSTLFVLGTSSNPETHDFQETVKSEHIQGVSFYPNHFGMISYGGAALGSDQIGESEEADVTSMVEPCKGSRTRLDVPNSFFVLRTPPTSDSFGAPTPTVARTPNSQS